MTLHSRMSQNPGTLSVIEQLLFDQAVKTVMPYVLCENFRTSNVMVNAQIQRKLHCRELRSEVVELADPMPENEQQSGGDEMLYTVLIPSYTVMFVFFLINIMARSFLQERDLGTLRRLRFAPISDPGLVAGKTIPFLLISLIQTGLLFLSGRLLFGMLWGPYPWMLIPVIFATSLSATALGLLVATLVRSDSQVSAYANIIVISMAGFSGCFMPRTWLPGPMQTASLVFPHAWALQAYEQLLVKPSPDISLVWQYCGVLIAFSTAYFIAGCVRFRHYD
jgi:ABC-type multidrug transport system permease subunit